MNIIKVLVVEPKKEPYIKEMKNTIGEVYGIVYAPIEMLKIEEDVFLIQSLGAKNIKDAFFPANRMFKGNILYSNFVIIGKNDDTFISLSNEQIKKYTNMFKLEKDY